jgi:hypothetical protein
MKHIKWHKTIWITLTAIIALAMMAGGAFAQSTDSSAAALATSTIDFQGLATGAIVSSISSGQGMSGDPVPGEIAVFGFNPDFGEGVNAAMILTPPARRAMSPGYRRDADLFKPELGQVLIVSQDMDSSDPNDANVPEDYLAFDFSGWGNGLVRVESVQVLDIENNNTGDANIELYSGGKDGTLIAPSTSRRQAITGSPLSPSTSRGRLHAGQPERFRGDQQPGCSSGFLYLSDTFGEGGISASTDW